VDHRNGERRIREVADCQDAVVEERDHLEDGGDCPEEAGTRTQVFERGDRRTRPVVRNGCVDI
jgi:hypothetical protein